MSLRATVSKINNGLSQISPFFDMIMLLQPIAVSGGSSNGISYFV